MVLNCGVGEDSWESLGLPVNPNGNPPWIFIERTDAEAEALILWPPDVKNWLIGKDPHAGKDWRQEEKGMTEDEMFGWHHWLGGHEFEQALGVGDGQGSLVCCSPWARKELNMTEWLNWTDWEKSWQNLVPQVIPREDCYLTQFGFLWAEAAMSADKTTYLVFNSFYHISSLQIWWVLKLKEVDQSSCLKLHCSLDSHPASSGSHASSISPQLSFTMKLASPPTTPVYLFPHGLSPYSVSNMTWKPLQPGQSEMSQSNPLLHLVYLHLAHLTLMVTRI